MRWIGALAIAGLVAGGVALAQKPPAVVPDPPPRQGGKTPPAATPAPPPATSPPAIAAPPAAPPAARPPAPLPPAAAVAPPVPAPLDEPTVVARLRTLLGANTTLAYDATEVIDPARGAVRLTNARITADGETMTIEELTLDDLRDDGVGEATLRNITAPGGLRLARLQIVNLTVRGSLGALTRGTGGGPLRPDAISAEAIRMEGLAVAAPDGTEVNAQTATLEDFLPGRPSRASLVGIEIKAPPGQEVGRMRLGRLVLRGLDLQAVLTAIVTQTVPPQPATGRQVLEAEDFTVTGPAGQPFGGIGSVRIANEQQANGNAAGTLAIRSIRVEPFPQIAQFMAMFGYQGALTVDLGLDARYDRARSLLELTSLSLAGRDIGALSLALALDGVKPEGMTPEAAMAIRLVSAAVRYSDASLLARTLRMLAQQSGVTEAQLRDQYAAMVSGALTVPGRNPLEPLRDALVRFIRGQATNLEITARPPQPIPLSTFAGTPPGSPAEAQRMLGLSAAAR